MKLHRRTLLLGALAAAGCSALLGDPIVGRWTATENNQTINFDFAKDGTLVTNIPMMGSGRWSALDGGRYALTFSVFGSQVSWIARIEGNALKVDPQQGNGEFELRRASP